jgi:predicted dehydrogenase
MRVGVGVVGCGTVCHVYLRNLLRFPDLRVVACADLDVGRAKAVAEQYGVGLAGDVQVLLDSTDVEIVVNLTNPVAHLEVSLAAVAAGKHVYSEKPIALDVGSGNRLVAAATAAGVRIAAAPDTFLGAGLQSAYRLIERGVIGVPLNAVTLIQGPGPETWHPNPQFLYQRGAGPLFDMGPYGLTALAAVFGPVTRVAATARRSRAERVIATGPHAGRSFPVEVPTHYIALLEFTDDRVANAVFSCDSPLHRFDFLEITGTEATLALPNPNMYDGHSMLRRIDDNDWTPVAQPVTAAGRGIGVLELARAVRSGRPHRNGADVALHILDTMTAIAESAERSVFVRVRSEFTMPALLPEGWSPEASTLGGDHE